MLRLHVEHLSLSSPLPMLVGVEAHLLTALLPVVLPLLVVLPLMPRPSVVAPPTALFPMGKRGL